MGQFLEQIALSRAGTRVHAARTFADVARGKWCPKFPKILCFWPTTQYVYVCWNLLETVFLLSEAAQI